MKGFVLRRASAIKEIQRRVNQELRTVTDMNSSTGVVVDDSEMIQRMAKRSEDDVVEHGKLWMIMVKYHRRQELLPVCIQNQTKVRVECQFLKLS